MDRRLEQAETFDASGRPFDAIRVLTEVNRERRDPAVAARLVELRRDAVPHVRRRKSRRGWPPRVRDRFAGTSGVPEIDRGRLSARMLRSAVFHHGFLIVRNLVDRRRVDQLVSDIDHAYAAYDVYSSGAGSTDPGGWYQQFQPSGDAFVPRPWLRSGGAVLAVDSPPALFDVIETFEEIGIGTLAARFLGERPLLLGQKCTLRRASATESFPDWHQDGSFMGANIRSLNVWISLSDCGIDAPSLDLVPRRLHHILDTGTGTATYGWGVDDTLVKETAEVEIVRPVFRPGDAILFDHYAMHRTGFDPNMPNTRYAIEAWFAAPSHYPSDQLAIAY